ncbi:hypothetical protein FQN57_006461 [Myotisia sp. PD_48]|nr:hypothetical protein FQN57_006461 [Myotisia sp. PD_48]
MPTATSTFAGGSQPFSPASMIGDQDEPTASLPSPYASDACSIYFHPKGKKYTVPERLIHCVPKLKALLVNSSLELYDVDEEVAHTLLHFLCTGTYETLKPRFCAMTPDEERMTEFRRSILVYNVARQYDIVGLEIQARQNILIYDKESTFVEFLMNARRVHPSQLEPDQWFSQFVKERMTGAYTQNDQIFKTEEFLDVMGFSSEFDKFLVQSIVDIYSDTLIGVTAFSALQDKPTETEGTEEATETPPKYDNKKVNMIRRTSLNKDAYGDHTKLEDISDIARIKEDDDFSIGPPLMSYNLRAKKRRVLL